MLPRLDLVNLGVTPGGVYGDSLQISNAFRDNQFTF